MSDFREDGRAAVDWVARYLEGVGDLPVLAQVEPGDIRAQLPASPPEEAEPFDAVLRDLDEVLLPGITHWNHPRFFAYFAISGSEPGILAELLIAALNVNGMLWRSSPAATELEELAADWVRQLMGLAEGWHGHIEDSASTSTLAALTAARELRPGGAVVCSEHAHSSVDKAARTPRAAAPQGGGGRGVPASPGRAGRGRGRGHRGGRRDRRDDLDHGRRPRAGGRRSCRAGRGMASRRRRLCGLGDGLRGAPLGLRGRRAG